MKTDDQLYSAVKDKLEFEPAIDSSHITLSIHNGIVTLSGTVKHYPEKHTVERAVRSIDGVKGIANDLEVNLLAHLKRNDTEIAEAAVNSLAWDTSIPANKIKVTVEHGAVKLTGEVNWWYQRQRAEKAVRNLMGVRQVDNQIKLTPTTSMISPTEVKAKILKEFERNAIIDANNIKIEVNNGKVTLKGHVRSWAENKEAERAAWSLSGVTDVDNQLMFIYG